MANDMQTELTDHQEEQLVVFRLGNESYGISITAVNTILRYTNVTPVPQMPDCVLGIMDLRGTMLPIIDLQTRLGLPSVERTKFTRVIVMENGSMLVGLVVSEVTGTLRISTTDIASLPMSMTAEYLRGICKAGDRLIVLLSLDAVLSLHEQESLLHIMQHDITSAVVS